MENEKNQSLLPDGWWQTLLKKMKDPNHIHIVDDSEVETSKPNIIQEMIEAEREKMRKK